MIEKKIIKNKEFPIFLNTLAKELTKYYYSQLNHQSIHLLDHTMDGCMHSDLNQSIAHKLSLRSLS